MNQADSYHGNNIQHTVSLFRHIYFWVILLLINSLYIVSTFNKPSNIFLHYITNILLRVKL